MRRLEVNISGYWYIALALVLGVVAMLSRNNVLYLIESLMLSGMIFSGILSERTISPVELEFRRRQAQAKSLVSDQIRIRNRSRFTLFCLEIGEWRNGKFHSIAYVPRLAGRAEIVIPSQENFDHRGMHSWNGAAVATSYPFGLTRKIRVLKDAKYAGSRLVWPESRLGRTNDDGLGRDAAKRIGNEYAEGEVRQYVPEDDCRSIVWTLSAKGTGDFVRLRKSADRDSRVTLDLRANPGVEFEKHVVAAAEQFYRLRGEDPTTGTLVVIDADSTQRAFRGKIPSLNFLATAQAAGVEAEKRSAS